MGIVCIIYNGIRSEDVHDDWKRMGELRREGKKLEAVKLYLKIKGRASVSHLKEEFILSDSDIEELTLDPEFELADVEFDGFGNIIAKNPVPKTLEERIAELEERVRAIEEKLRRVKI